MLTAAILLTTISRLWGLARSPWDWDEMLFALALDDFDVPNHRPHPPGFPLFIATAKAFQLIGLSDFRSLQMVNLIAGFLIVPAMFLFCRELRLRPSTSLAAALFLAFLPNVWFFGGSAFSDVPSLVLVLFAAAFLLRGARDARALLGGALLLAIAAGYRPQNLTVGALPLCLAAYHQLRARRAGVVLVSALVIAAVLGATYGLAAHFSGGWSAFRSAVELHQHYITSVDSFRNPDRPSLLNLSDDFFIRPFRASFLNYTIAALALLSVLASLVRWRWPILIALGCFGPFAVAAWLILDHFSASRFSIGYAPLPALLAADGVALCALLSGDARARLGQLAGSALLLLGMVIWTAPAIAFSRANVSPPLQAVRWILQNVPPERSVIYVHGSMGPYAEEYLRRYQRRYVEAFPSANLDPVPAWHLEEGQSLQPGARNFGWPHARLWDLARRRYFEAYVAPVVGAVRFEEGWYDQEGGEGSIWRWMGRESRTLLPAVPGGRAGMTLHLAVPTHPRGVKPVIEVHLNGQLLERFQPQEAFPVRHYRDLPAGQPVNELVLRTSSVVNPSREGVGEDPRDLGLQLNGLEWVASSP